MKINIQMTSRGYGKTYRLIRKYEKAKDIFNKKYKDKYKICLFQDLYFLNIYLHYLNLNQFAHCQILNECVQNLSVEEIVKAYEELIVKVGE